MKTLLKLIFSAVLILNRINLSAHTIEVQGIISENTVWDADTIKVIGYITIEDSVTLTIAPGAYVEFQGEYGIRVLGKLSAIGTVTDTITFTVRDTTGYSQNNHNGWRGIQFYVGYNKVAFDTSRLIYCKLMYGMGQDYGGAIECSYRGKLILSNCLLMHNYAHSGGAIEVEGSALLTNNKILFNKAKIGGGIKFGLTESVILFNNLICNNTAESSGGGIYLDYSSEDDTTYLINNTICNNNAPAGGGICFAGHSLGISPVLLNNIIWYNNSETDKNQFYFIDFNLKSQFYNNNIEGGKNEYSDDFPISFIYEDNIDVNPWFSDTNNYRLADSSHCINSGKSAIPEISFINKDLADNPRIYDGFIDKIDMGAYEFQGDPVNRKPLLMTTGNRHTFINAVKNMKVDFADFDPADTHTITITSDNSNVTVSNLSGNITGSTYDLIPSGDWTGEADITVRVTDNHGNYDSETFELIVSDSVSGSIKEDTYWNLDTVRITGDIIIEDGVTLFIDPGTIIVFYGNYEIHVQGRILAAGNPTDYITITTCDTSGYYNNTHTGWGGIRFYNTPETNDTSKLLYCNIQFVRNETDFGCLSFIHYSKAIISSCHIRNNISLSNALIEISGAQPSITSNFITENRIAEGQHLLDISSCRSTFNPRLVNNLICNNDCPSGVINIDESNIEIINNTICNNKVDHAIIYGYISDLSFINTIFWGNYSDNSLRLFSFYKITCDAIFESCLMPEELYANRQSYSDIYMNNIILLDPYFSDSESTDYSLSDSSYCINTGTADTAGLNLPFDDIAGNPRIYNGINMRIDIGAYEFQGTPNKRPVLKKTPDQYTLVSTSKLMKINYIDDDIDAIYILSDNLNVIPVNLTGDTTGSKYELVPADRWVGEANIIIQIEDVMGNMDSDTFKLFVSKYYCGPITENMIWDIDTVKVCCDVTVADGTTLIIAPGTTIEFLDNYTMEIQGRIIAAGTLTEPITFTVADTTGYHNNAHPGWEGIRFYQTPGANDTSKLVHCILEYSKEPPIYIWDFDKLLISGCDIRNNNASGIWINYSDVIIKNNKIHNNKTDNDGGGVSVHFDSRPFLVNNLIFNNTAKNEGGGLFVSSGSVNAMNNTIFCNQAKAGGGINLGPIWENIVFKNTIIRENIAFNSGQQIYIGSSSYEIELHYCNIEGGKDSIKGSGSEDMLIYANNIDAVPYFTDEENDDFNLSDTSECINAGDPQTDISEFPFDIAGNPRIMDDTIDIGAYEFPINSAPSEILLSEKQIDENVLPGSVVGHFSTVDANQSDTHTYSFDTGDGINDADNNSFIISGDSLMINLCPDFEEKDIYRIYVKTTDNGFNKLSYSNACVVIIADINEQPVLEPQSFAIDENSQAGTIVGTITASDVDAGQTLTYSIISGNTDNAFTVDPLTGKITVNNSDALDYETTPSFGLTINVQDNGPGNLEDEALISVNVNDIDEPVSIIDFDSDILRIYPNPVKGSVYLEFSDGNHGELLVELRSVNGTIYYQSENKVSDTDRIIELELSDLPEGLYILNVKSNTIFITRKIDIIRIR